MAKLDGITEIATQKSNIAIDVYKTLHRTKSYPLDSTEIFTSKDIAEKYAKGDATGTGNKYQTAGASYPGQHITIVDTEHNTATMYQIQNTNGDLKKIMTEPLAGQEFDFDQYTLSEVLKQVIEALGGTVKQTPEPEA